MELSFGGATAYALCEDQPEFVCGINIDGGLYGNHDGKILRTPFLQISCEQNINVVTRAFIHHTEPVYQAVIKDMKHMITIDPDFKSNGAVTFKEYAPDEK